MKMTRIHFRMIAKAVEGLEVSKATKKKVAKGLASELRMTNNMFNTDKFINACMK